MSESPDLIELQGGVNRDGKPFVHVLFDGEKVGQLTPGEALNFGIRGIQFAIEAERDAALLLAMKKVDDSDEFAAAMLTLVREHRSQVDPDPRGDVRGPGDG